MTTTGHILGLDWDCSDWVIGRLLEGLYGRVCGGELGRPLITCDQVSFIASAPMRVAFSNLAVKHFVLIRFLICCAVRADIHSWIPVGANRIMAGLIELHKVIGI